MDEYEKNRDAEQGQLFLATIGNYSSSGCTLIFDGQTAATTKRYRYIYTGSSNYLTSGRRVVVAKIGGSFVILGRLN